MVVEETVTKHLAIADLQEALLLVRRAQANIRGNPKCTTAASLMTTDDNTLLL